MKMSVEEDTVFFGTSRSTKTGNVFLTDYSKGSLNNILSLIHVDYVLVATGVGNINHVPVSNYSSLVNSQLISRLQVIRELNKFSYKIVLVSTAAVYGSACNPLSEDSPLSPISEYGKDRLSAEYALLNPNYFKNGDQVFRVFSTFGAVQLKLVVFDIFCRLGAAREGDSLSIENSNFVRNFVSLDSLAELILSLLRQRPSESILNVGSEFTININDLALLVSSMMGKKLFFNSIDTLAGYHPQELFPNLSLMAKYVYVPSRESQIQNLNRTIKEWSKL